MNKRIPAIMLIALYMIINFTVSGCSNNSNYPEIEYLIGISQANMHDPWRIILTRELNEEAAKHANIRLIFTDATQKSNKQINDIDNLLKYGIDLLIVSPCDVEALTPVVSRVYRQIPVIVLDRAVEGYDYSLFIGPDNGSIGKLAGKTILEVAKSVNKRKVNVLEIFAEYDSQATIERRQALSKTLSQNTAIKTQELVIGDQRSDTAEDALTNNMDLLQNIDIICAHSDDVALGAYRALEKIGLNEDIKIISIDGYAGNDGGLELVKKGMITSTITSPTGGREAIQSAQDILNRISGVPKQIILRSHNINQTNIDAYENMINRDAQPVSQNLRVGYAQVGRESLWREANNKSIQDAAQAAKIQLLAVDANQSQNKQLEAVRYFIQENVDVIVISPVVSAGWDEVLTEAKEAGIPVLLSDRNIEVSDEDMFMTFIGADFIEEGCRAMRWIQNNVPLGHKNVRIMELQGTIGSTPTVERKLGFESLLALTPDCEIVYSKSGDFTFEGGRNIVEDYLNNYDWNIDVIFAHNDDMALGAISTLEEWGLSPGTDIKIVSVDGTSEALKAIKDGKLNCSVECSPLLGPQVMKAITDLMSGKELPLRIITDEIVFTSENVKDALPGRKY